MIIMEEIYTKARAKINLNLNILDKRTDNYHNIKSVFQKINLYDEILIIKNHNNTFEIKSNIDILNNNENIIYKTYMRLKSLYPKIDGVKVLLNKRIPMQAGLGGGSSDCASFIISMNKLFDLNLSFEEMTKLGKILGADVVSCFYNQALIAEGIGDIINIIDTNFKYYIVLIKPNINCNTKEMYDLIDLQSKISSFDSTNLLVEGLEKNNLELLSKNLYNDFENVQLHKDYLLSIKDNLKNNGAIGCLMTGSGSCVYGLFENKETAKSAYQKLKTKYQTYICSSYNCQKKSY